MAVLANVNTHSGTVHVCVCVRWSGLTRSGAKVEIGGGAGGRRRHFSIPSSPSSGGHSVRSTTAVFELQPHRILSGVEGAAHVLRE